MHVTLARANQLLVGQYYRVSCVKNAFQIKQFLLGNAITEIKAVAYSLIFMQPILSN